MIHPKVAWASVAAALVAALFAVQSALGPNGPAWLGAVAAGIAAFVGGYAAPALDTSYPEHPAGQDPEATK